MNANFLKINSDKTEILLFYPPSLSSEIIIKGTFIDGQCIRFSNDVKNVGVWLDKHLNLEKHINKIVSHWPQTIEGHRKSTECVNEQAH